MTAEKFGFPKKKKLASVLSQHLADLGIAAGRIRIKRRDKEQIGWNHSEIVHCRVKDGPSFRIFCKYSSGDDAGRHKYGHRGGVRYEAAVYQRLLSRTPMSLPRFLGVHDDRENDRLWLFIEYLKHGKRVSRTRSYRQNMTDAASWCGRFHAVNPAADIPAEYLSYDAEYFKGWARRTLLYADVSQRELSWLEDVCRGYEDLVADLDGSPRTLIHGEYYPANILVQKSTIYPIDWETAAFAPGEVDLAMLTDCWPEDVSRACVDAYQAARWPSGAPPHDFARTLGVARIYTHLRWLGDRPEWTTHPKSGYRFDALRQAAQSIGLI